MKEILKEIDMMLEMTGLVSGDIDLFVQVTDNATYQRAKKYCKFATDSAFQKPVKGLYPKETHIEWDEKDSLKTVKVIVEVTQDYEKGSTE